MRLSLESGSSGNRIRGYAPGKVYIGETVYRRSFVVSAEHLIADWRPDTFDDLTSDDVAALAALDPEVVILGCGATQRFPKPGTIAPLTCRGIGVEVMETGAACRTFNVLLAEDRRVVAALII